MYRVALRPLLFSLPPDVAHWVAMAALAPVEHLAPVRACVQGLLAPPRDERLVVRAMGIEFAHPLGLAGGFDKEGRRPRALAALGFAHVEIGTVTAQPQAANPKPNMARLPADRALVNRLGFPNSGATVVAKRLAASRSDGTSPASPERGRNLTVRVPLGVSIGKSRVVPVDDVEAVVRDYSSALEAVRPVADFVVVNVSSPNTAGLRAMQHGAHARTLLSSLAARAQGRPLLVKIAPDLEDAQIEDLLAVVEEVGLAGVVATNTTVSRAGLSTPADRVEAAGAGGLSGPPLRARALEVVRRVRSRLGRKIAVVGVGGIETADDAIAFVRAGADLLQMYTGLVYEGPGAPGRIARGLAAMLDREGVRGISELVGVAVA
jgi:dihydroorotate dehydrogenase